MKNKLLFIIVALLLNVFAQAQNPILGTTDINAYIQEAPGLPTTTDEAMKRAAAHPLQPDFGAMDRFYKPFEDKVSRRIEDYQRFAQQKMAKASTIQAEYEAATSYMVDSSPVIAGMGGYDKVKQMSPEEARATAQQSAAAYVTDPFAANGIQSAGMTALYQKIIADPAFAKRFENMSDVEKEAELRKYMANDTPATMTPNQAKAHQQTVTAQQSQADRVRNAQEIQMKLLEWQQRLSEIGTAASIQLQKTKQEGRTHEVISEEIGLRYEAIPMVELGEYGHDHDPK